jgi:uncharacterized protein
MMASDELVMQLSELVDVGDVVGLAAHLAAHSELATERFGDGVMSRTILHVIADWPGHRPNGGEMVRVAIAAGAEVDARFAGPHRETALHWAASSDDVAVLDALLDGGADIEADGAVIGGGTALWDAVAFGQWNAARRLVEHGAHMELWHVAALGPLDRLQTLVAAQGPSSSDITNALWNAGAGGQRDIAEWLVAEGADATWVGHDHLTAAGAARRSGHDELAAWLDRASQR